MYTSHKWLVFLNCLSNVVMADCFPIFLSLRASVCVRTYVCAQWVDNISLSTIALVCSTFKAALNLNMWPKFCNR